jgi:hypothetical protein
MQEGGRSIELDLGLFGAGDRKVNPAQVVAGMVFDWTPRFARASPKQNSNQTGTQEHGDGTTTIIH